VTIVETDPTDHIQTITRQFKTLKRQTGKWKITGNCGFTDAKTFEFDGLRLPASYANS
jgi:hypothetical protein